jgi:hypothetical protein
MRVPHEISHLVGNSHLVGHLRADVEKFHIVFVAALVVEVFDGQGEGKFMLAKAGLYEFLLGDEGSAVVEGRQFMN